MQADVVIAFTLPVDLMSLDAREGTVEKKNFFESRIVKFVVTKGPSNERGGEDEEEHGFVFTCTYARLDSNINTFRRFEAATSRKGRGTWQSFVESRPCSIEACRLDREA